MDPASLSILLHNLVPIVSILAVFGMPVGIVWTIKHHKYKMRELELEEHGGRRMASLEARLAAIEAALGVQPQLGSPAQHRAAMLEAPARPSEVETNPDLPRLRQK